MSRIDEIKARLAAATPGPWKQTLPDDTTVIGQNNDTVCVTAGEDYEEDFERMEANAAMIAHAPSDLSWLLERNAKLEEENAILRAELEDEKAAHAKTMDSFTEYVEEAGVEKNSLRAELEWDLSLWQDASAQDGAA